MKTKVYLKKTASCPGPAGGEQAAEIRTEKVRQIRGKLKAGTYNLDERLSLAMDRLLEEILIQNSENQADF